jgi:predicted RNA-binding Zn-ribbon protein involved in translation (DUF1610 family)
MWKILREWLLSATALRAWIQIVVAIGVGVAYGRIAHVRGVEYAVFRLVLGLALIFLITGPVWYFFLPPLMFGAGVLMIRFTKQTAEYPCPVCGYDIRATPHRCPECGTELRWGQLVK